MTMTAYTFRKLAAYYVFVIFKGFTQGYKHIGHAQIQGAGDRKSGPPTLENHKFP